MENGNEKSIVILADLFFDLFEDSDLEVLVTVGKQLNQVLIY